MSYDLSENAQKLSSSVPTVKPNVSNDVAVQPEMQDREKATKIPDITEPSRINNEVAAFMSSVSVKKLIPKDQDLVVIFEDFEISRVINFIAPHSINACPVCDQNGNLKAVVSVMDMVGWVTSLRSENEQQKDSAEDSSDSQYHEKPKAEAREGWFKQLTIGGLKTREGTIGDVIKFLKCSAPTTLTLDASALDAAKLFAKGVKMIVFVDHAMAPMNVFTQKDFVKYIHEEMNSNSVCKEFRNYSLQDLGLSVMGLQIKTDIRTISTTSTLLDAMNYLYRYGGALPIIDSLGVIQGNFSAMDIKGLTVEVAPAFNQWICRFLKSTHPDSLKPICFTAADTYYSCSKLFDKWNIHHLWLVDALSKPIRCYSMTDHIHLLLHAQIASSATPKSSCSIL